VLPLMLWAVALPLSTRHLRILITPSFDGVLQDCIFRFSTRWACLQRKINSFGA
jgi:hypothetical protein